MIKKQLKFNAVITFISACGAFLVQELPVELLENKAHHFFDFLGMFFLVFTICTAARVLRLVYLLEDSREERRRL